MKRTNIIRAKEKKMEGSSLGILLLPVHTKIEFPSCMYVILENVKCFKYLGSMLTEDGRCTCEIKSRIAMVKAAFNKKKNLFTSKLDLNLRKRLVSCYVWSIAL